MAKQTLKRTVSSDGFCAQVLPFVNQLHARARRLTRTQADAEDLVQDTLLKAYAGFGSFREGTNLLAWLHRIMYNAWINQHRAMQRRPLEQLTDELTDTQLAHHEAHLSSCTRSAEVEALDATLDSKIIDALAHLPVGSLQALYLSYVQELRYSEIAELMGIPTGTVMSRLFRARRKLRSLLVDLRTDRDFDVAS